MKNITLPTSTAFQPRPNNFFGYIPLPETLPKKMPLQRKNITNMETNASHEKN